MVENDSRSRIPDSRWHIAGPSPIIPCSGPIHSCERLRLRETVSALFIAGMLFFSLVVVPEHASSICPHDHCLICSLIHNPPDLPSVDAAGAAPRFLPGLLVPIAAVAAVAEPRAGMDSPRAPPPPR